MIDLLRLNGVMIDLSLFHGHRHYLRPIDTLPLMIGSIGFNLKMS